MSRSRHRRPLAVAVLAAIAVLSSLITASPAAADYQKTYTHDYIQGFGKSGSFVMVSPSFCVRWRVGGVLRYRATVVKEVRSTSAPGTVAYGYSISNIRMSTNQVEINTFVARSGRCTTTRKRFSAVTLEEKMRGYSCDFNPQVSVGFPWAFGVGLWPSCGSKNLARLSIKSGDDSSRFVMTNSAVVVKFPGRQDKGWYPEPRTNLDWKCYGANARITLQTTTASNVKDTPRVPICAGWGGSRSGW